jgi:hypothetical protein
MTKDKLAANQKKTVKNFETLKAKLIGPMAKFCAEAMKHGGTIFERLGFLEDAVKGILDDGNLFGAISFMGGLTQNGKFGSPRHISEFKKQISILKKTNLDLMTELETLKECKASSLGVQIGGESQDP